MQRHLRLTALACSLLLPGGPAAALVGGAPPAPAALTRHLVMIVGSRGSFCSGAVLARDLVLTAAHCVQPGAEYRLIELTPGGAPTLRAVSAIERHPQFSLATLNGHRATADLAVLRTAEPLPARFVPVTLAPALRVAPGERLTVAGFGVTRRGDGATSGTARAVTLATTGRPGSLQIRLVDPATDNRRPGLGACTGDSGAPVFLPGARPELIGVVSWSTGAGNSDGCGGLTGVTPLLRYRDWIIATMRRLR